MKKDTIGIICFIVGLVWLLISTPQITGNAILENFRFEFSYSYIIGIFFIFASIIIFINRQTLDAIVIPTGGGDLDIETGMSYQDKERTQKALRRKNRLGDKGYFIISGHRDPKSEEGQSQSIQRYLTEQGIKSSDILIEGKSHDTLENVIYTLKRIKEEEAKRHGKRRRPLKVAFISYPEHLDRFEDFEKESLNRGLIKEGDFEFHKIRTFPKWENRKKQRSQEKKYEGNILRRLAHRYKLMSLRKYK